MSDKEKEQAIEIAARDARARAVENRERIEEHCMSKGFDWKWFGILCWRVFVGIVSVVALWAVTLALYYTFPDGGPGKHEAVALAFGAEWVIVVLGLLTGNLALWGIL